MHPQLLRSSRGLLTAVFLLLPSIPAAAQDCIFVPDNDPNTGPASIQPFGGTDPNDVQTANQHLLVRIPNALFPRRRVQIREIGFAPAGSGTRTLGRVTVSLGSLPAGTPLSPTFFLNHPGFGAGVMDGVVWDWPVTAGQWNHLGWRTSFPFDPTSNLDLILEIDVQGGALTGGANPGFHSDPSLDHVYAAGYVGQAPRDGVVGQGAPKMKICFDDAVLGVFGRGCPGSAGVPTFGFTGSSALGANLGIQLGNGPANGTALLIADPRVATATSDLTRFGMPGCRQYTFLPGLVSAVVPLSANGGALLNVTMPNTPGAVGGIVFLQAYYLDPPANWLGFVSSPVGYVQIGS